MANNITADPNCISLWRFEEDLFLADEMGNNDLTYSNPSWPPIKDTALYKEGDCSAKWTLGDEEAFVIDDGDLSAGFPLKDGGGQTTFSWVAWIYCDVGFADHYLFGKMSLGGGVDTAFYIKYSSTTWAFSASGNETSSGISVAELTWQHVAVTYDGDTDQLTIRVYNDDTKVTDSYQTTLSGGDVVVTGSEPWVVGAPNYNLDVWIDELAVFDDVLTPAEIDEIRAGTFGDGGGGGEEQTTGDGGGISTFFLGCPF